MGIVVCVSLLLSLLVFLDRKLRARRPEKNSLALVSRPEVAIAWVLLVVGLWNILWYGLRHMHAFWGQVAIASGLSMLFAAILLHGSRQTEASSLISKVYRWVRPIKPLIIVGLFASFLLYAITLIQLNLGMEIIN